MFKKASKIAVSFALLVGAYNGYIRLFAVVTNLLEISREEVELSSIETDSKTAMRANELARESFPQGHWAAEKDLRLQWYDASRGIYMYTQNYKTLNDRKRMEVWPFALIWVSKDGKARKMATSDRAVIDMSQPFGLVKSGAGPSKITHAKLEGDVRLRDDKGTRNDPSDDLRVGPLTYVEFDDTTLQITSESDVFLKDRDLTLTGIGLMIQLRRKGLKPDDSPGGGGGGSGFDAETLHVYKDIHIVVNNVTSDGVLPGQAKPEKTGKIPIDVRSDNEMTVKLPKPRPIVPVGPIDLTRAPDPTYISFKTNVQVIRGTDKADQLNCDTLDLTMMPDPKKIDLEAEVQESDGMQVVAGEPAKAADGSEPAPSGDGMMTELKIRKALARGNAVWLQSEAQGMVARCIELRYEKRSIDGLPDLTYLNGGPGKKLRVEKVDYDTKAAPGTIKSIMVMTALDATILDSGPGGSSKVIARGPGKSEERPARNASVTRTVWWEDEMEMLTWRDGEAPNPTPSPLAARALSDPRPQVARGTLRRLITLSGISKLVDVETSTTLDARKSIVAEFQAEPNPPPAKGEGPTQIKWLDAFEDAHLTAPSKSLTARLFLKAKFENQAAPPKVVAVSTPAPGPVPAGGPAPMVASNNGSPSPSPTPSEPKVETSPKPSDPLVEGRADRVWADVLLGATGQGAKDNKGELKVAKLRGGVMVHQDPAPGKVYGSEASGEALDLYGQGNGLIKFVVKAEEPQASEAKTRLASESKGRRPLSTRTAKVETEGKSIESEDVIGLDQKANFAWSQGAGVFLQMADQGLLDDQGIEGEKVRVAAKPTQIQADNKTIIKPKDRLAISWNEEMRFYGQAVDLEGRPAAKIEFRGTSKDVRTPDGRREFRRGVEAKMTDSAIYTDTMDVYMDRPMALNQPDSKTAKSKNEPKQPDPQIAMLDCQGKDLVEGGEVKFPGVDVISQKLFPESGELKEKQRIQGQHVIYDKRTGNFYAPGSGVAYIYRRKDKDGAAAKPEAPIATVRPVASPSNARTKPGLITTTARKLTALELTKVRFSEGMRGRFGVARDVPDADRREAEFHGDVAAVNASVSDKNSDIEFDRLDGRKDVFYLTSDILNIFSEPAPQGSKSANRQLLNARGNALARANFDIIQSDRITYDSASGLAYAYGDDGKDVSFTKQASTGQRPDTTRGNSFRYNKETGAGEFKDPHAILFTDLKSGLRSKPFFPDLGGTPKAPDPIKWPRQPMQRQSRSSTERNSFSGH